MTPKDMVEPGKKDVVDQARADMLKTIRTAVRLKHSIAADNELNELLPKAERAFNKAVMHGQLPDPLDIKALVVLPDDDDSA